MYISFLAILSNVIGNFQVFFFEVFPYLQMESGCCFSAWLTKLHLPLGSADLLSAFSWGFFNKVSSITTLFEHFPNYKKSASGSTTWIFELNHFLYQFSCSVASDSLWPHGLQHTKLPCPSPTPGTCSNSCPLSWWYHPTVSSSVVPFSSCPPSFPASGSFPMSQLFTSGGQRIGTSASASVLPVNIQEWFPSGWTGWSLCSPRDFQESSPKPQFQSIKSLTLSFLFGPTLTSIHDYWKNHSFD